MPNYWLTKIGLMLVTLSIAVSCSMQGKDQTKNQLEELQGQILVWVELPTESHKNPKDSKKISFEDSIEKFKELYLSSARRHPIYRAMNRGQGLEKHS